MRQCGIITLLAAVLFVTACTQDPFERNSYVNTMRTGLKAYDHGDYTRAAGVFKETLEDTTFAGLYNYALASHEAEDDVEAIRALDTLHRQELIPEDYSVPARLNLANDCLTEAVRTEAKEKLAQEQQPEAQAEGQPQGSQAVELYRQAMEHYEQYLLEVPADMDAKERYLYCKSKMPPQDGGGGGGQDQQNQDQDQQDQDQQDQNQDQQDQNQDRQNQQDQQEQQQDQLNEQQIYQMLEAKEKETRDKLDEKKAKAIGLRQKDRKKW